MRIQLENTWLAAGGLEGPANLSLNGEQLVDEVAFFRAALRTFYARGNAAVTLQFTVSRQFDTIRDAEYFLLLHFATLPLSGLVQCWIGDDSSTEAIYLDNAVVEAVAIPAQKGTCIAVQYTIKGAAFASSVAPGDLPGTVGGPEVFIVMRRGRVAIPAAATSIAVVFSAALASVPTVTATISRPAGGDAIWPIVREDTITVNGFTADLSGATVDATYKLNYLAVE